MRSGQRARRSDAVRNAELVHAAAIELFSEMGMEVTPAAIAEKAGVGRATVYRAFPNRAALIDALCENRVQWVREQLERAVEQANAWQAQVALTHALLERMRVDRGLIEVIAPTRDIEHHRAVTLGPLFERQLAKVKATGRIRPDITGIDIGDLTSGMASSLRRRQDHDPASWQRAADLVLAACGSYPPGLD